MWRLTGLTACGHTRAAAATAIRLVKSFARRRHATFQSLKTIRTRASTCSLLAILLTRRATSTRPSRTPHDCSLAESAYHCLKGSSRDFVQQEVPAQRNAELPLSVPGKRTLLPVIPCCPASSCGYSCEPHLILSSSSIMAQRTCHGAGLGHKGVCGDAELSSGTDVVQQMRQTADSGACCTLQLHLRYAIYWSPCSAAEHVGALWHAS